VDAKTKLHMKVPLHYSGAEESPAVKVDKCLVTPVVTELNVSCMPSDLPEFINVDLSNLQKNVSLHLKDIKLPKGVSAVIRGSQTNPVLVSVVAPAAEAPAPAEGEAAPAAAPAKKGKK
jgi:large subunit ribosomal protein L25